MPSNLPEVQTAFADVLPEIATRNGWIEVRSRFTEGSGDETERIGTRHAKLGGYRLVFRVLVRLPEGAGDEAWLEKALGDSPPKDLPAGARMALVATPLAIAASGDLVEVPVAAAPGTGLRPEAPAAASSSPVAAATPAARAVRRISTR